MHFWPDQWEAVAAGEPITFRGPGLLGDMEKGSEGGRHAFPEGLYKSDGHPSVCVEKATLLHDG